MIINNIQLSKTIEADLYTLFEFQLDKEAIHWAAFTPSNPNDQTAYLEKYKKHIADPSINMQTIKINDEIVGSLAKYVMENEAEITYWVDRKYWGQGIATNALTEFLKTELIRPIYGRVAFDNLGSQKVLEKCGFLKIGNDFGYANARQKEIEEFIYKLS